MKDMTCGGMGREWMGRGWRVGVVFVRGRGEGEER
jgi:hypothetical protein